jgi:hypothetical protein
MSREAASGPEAQGRARASTSGCAGLSAAARHLPGPAAGHDENAPTRSPPASTSPAVGDFSFYWIQDGIGLEIQRLDELFALTNQVGWLASQADRRDAGPGRGVPPAQAG